MQLRYHFESSSSGHLQATVVELLALVAPVVLGGGSLDTVLKLLESQVEGMKTNAFELKSALPLTNAGVLGEALAVE